MEKGMMQVAVDAVVFTVLNNDLKVLLIRRKNEPFKGKYALPGGFINADESAEDAVKRELCEETGVGDIFLKQIKTYTQPKRDPRGRVLSIAYLALIKPEQDLIAATDALTAEWKPVGALPELAFDHKGIINEALLQLRYEIQTTNIAYQILPERFTLTELQELYQKILEKDLDKRNFRKRLNELNILKETKETKMQGAHRPALLYSFRNKTYTSIKEKMHVFLN